LFQTVTIKTYVMKTKQLMISALALFLVIGPGKPGIAQAPEAPEAEEADRVYEQEWREVQEDQKKAQEMELKRRKEILVEERQQWQDQQEEMRELERQYAEEARVMAREAARVRPHTRTVVIDGDEGDFVFFTPGQSQTQLTLRNTFRGGTDSSTGTFDVEEGTRQFRCMINGKVRSGQISIKILYPGGKTFKHLEITSAAEISFNQSLMIKEDEQSKYIGAWKYEVKADKAEGTYVLQVSTQ